MLVFASTLLASGAGVVSAEPDKPKARVQLICEHTAAVPGSTAFLGVHFKLDPTWHVYWNGRSDSGGPIEITLDLPPGYTAQPTQWPAPKRHISDGDILDHVYEDEVTLIIPVQVPADAKGTAAITGKVSYVICSSTCIFEDAALSLTLPIDTAKPKPSKNTKLFETTRTRLPKPVPTGDTAPSITRDGNKVAISAPGAASLAFYPDTDCIGLVDLIKSGRADQPRLTLMLDPESDTKLPVSGVLEARYPDTRGTAWFWLSSPSQWEGAGGRANSHDVDSHSQPPNVPKPQCPKK